MLDDVQSTLLFLFHVFLSPTNVGFVDAFYFAWMVLFSATHIIWDIRTTKTQPWHISQLNQRLPPFHSAAVFASSLLILLGVIQPEVRKQVVETIVPLIIAGLASLCYALADICPYKVPIKGVLPGTISKDATPPAA